MMRRVIVLLRLAVLLVLLRASGFAGTIAVVVPGISDLWLAGMPPGSRASSTDVAPDQSPVEVSGFSLQPGTALDFSAIGLVSNGVCGPPFCPTFGPDGGIKPDEIPFFHETGPENGISNLGAPINSLIGLFLGPGAPNLAPPPAALDFNPSAAQDYLTVSPLLQQGFFIGNGFTSDGIQQQIIIPAGASRLYLGTMDGCCWIDNLGSFTVQVSEVPEPSTALLLGFAMLLVAVRRIFAWSEPASRNARLSIRSMPK